MKFIRIFFFLSLITTPLLLFCSPASKVVPPSKAVPSHRNNKPPLKTHKGALIILDPGHGGFDMGAEAPGVQEKMLALTTAILLKKHLSDKGYRVILTRSKDVFVSLSKRSTIANSTKSTLFLSLHYNAHVKADPSGIEVYYYREGSSSRSAASKKLAQNVLSHMIALTGAESRGVKHGNLHVIRETKMPAILVEGGFITNPKERNKLKENEYLDQIALGIAEGVDKYFNTK